MCYDLAMTFPRVHRSSCVHNRLECTQNSASILRCCIDQCYCYLLLSAGVCDPNLKYIPGTTTPLKFVYTGIVRKGCPVMVGAKGRVGDSMMHTVEWVGRRIHPSCVGLVNEDSIGDYKGEPNQELALCGAELWGTWRYAESQCTACTPTGVLLPAGVPCLGGCGRLLLGAEAFVQCARCRTGGSNSRFVSGEGGSLRAAHFAASSTLHRQAIREADGYSSSDDSQIPLNSDEDEDEGSGDDVSEAVRCVKKAAFVSDDDTGSSGDELYEDEYIEYDNNDNPVATFRGAQRISELESSIAGRRKLHGFARKKNASEKVTLPGARLGAKHTIPLVLRPPNDVEWPSPVVSIYPPDEVGFDEADHRRHNEIAHAVLKSSSGSMTGRTQGTTDTVQLHWGASSAQQAIGHSRFRQLVLHGRMVDDSDLDCLTVRLAPSNPVARVVVSTARSPLGPLSVEPALGPLSVEPALGPLSVEPAIGPLSVGRAPHMCVHCPLDGQVDDVRSIKHHAGLHQRAGTDELKAIPGAMEMIEERLRAVWSLVLRDAALDTEMGRALAARIAEMERHTQPVCFRVEGWSSECVNELCDELGFASDDARRGSTISFEYSPRLVADIPIGWGTLNVARIRPQEGNQEAHPILSRCVCPQVSDRGWGGVGGRGARWMAWCHCGHAACTSTIVDGAMPLWTRRLHIGHSPQCVTGTSHCGHAACTLAIVHNVWQVQAIVDMPPAHWP